MSSSLKKLLATIRDAAGQDWQTAVTDYLKSHKLSAAETEALGLDVYHIILKEAVANLHISSDEAANLLAIQGFFGLSDTAVRELRRSYAPKALKMLLDWFLIDKILTPSETAQIIAFGKEMSLSEAEVEEIIAAAAAKLQ